MSRCTSLLVALLLAALPLASLAQPPARASCCLAASKAKTVGWIIW